MTEKVLEAKFVRDVRALGGVTYKFVSPGNVGVPDRIVITPEGRVWFVELKTETGKLSKMQRYQLNRLRAQNCNVVVLYGVAEVENTVRAIFQNARGGDAG